jgi:hypothetical protein
MDTSAPASTPAPAPVPAPAPASVAIVSCGRRFKTYVDFTLVRDGDGIITNAVANFHAEGDFSEYEGAKMASSVMGDALAVMPDLIAVLNRGKRKIIERTPVEVPRPEQLDAVQDDADILNFGDEEEEEEEKEPETKRRRLEDPEDDQATQPELEGAHAGDAAGALAVADGAATH